MIFFNSLKKVKVGQKHTHTHSVPNKALKPEHSQHPKSVLTDVSLSPTLICSQQYLDILSVHYLSQFISHTDTQINLCYGYTYK